MAVYPERRKGRLSGCWIAEVTQAGERRRKRFPTKHEAERWADFTKLTGLPPPGDNTAPAGHTLGSVMADANQHHPGWQRGRDLSRQQRLDYCLGVLGADTLIDKLKTTDLDRVVASLKRRPGQQGRTTLSPASINRYLAGVSALLTYARKRGYTTSSIVVPWQKEAGQRVHWLTDEAEADLCAEMLRMGCKDAELTLRVLARTGMRWGELETLTPGQITDEWVKLDLTKTDTPRDIPIEPSLATELREMVTAKRVPSYGIMRKVLIAALEGAGQTPAFTIHCLRHTTATRLVLSEVNLAVVQKFMGHSNIHTTLKYTHVTQQSLQDALKKVSQHEGQSTKNSGEKAL